MLAIAGGKGGCGKTTTTLGLAGALVRQRKPALAADADREMPDLHAMAGVTRDPGLDAVAAGWPPGLVAGIADAPVCGVAVLPAPSGPPGRRRPSEHLQTPLARLRGADGAVLLDCPAGAGPDAVAPLRAADAAVVVTTIEPACLRDAAKTAAMARELGTPVAGAVVSRAHEPPAEIGALLDCGLLEAVPDAARATDAARVTDAVRATDAAQATDAVRATDGVANARPLADDRVRAAHDRLLSALQPKYL